MISAFAVAMDEGTEIQYALDIRDATDEGFLARLGQFLEDPSNQVNRAELAPISDTEWFAVPDLSDRQFRIVS